MNLVVGATGLLGSEICHRLAAKNFPTRALVRETSDPSRIAELSRLGAELVYGDLRDAASLEEACDGVDAIITTASSMPFAYKKGENDVRAVDSDGLMNLIEAASAAKVGRFVYTSFSGHIDLDFPLRNAKRAVEDRLRASGLEFTILRPSYFMEVWLSPAVGFDPAHGKAQLYGSGDRPISWISLKDVADFAVECLDHPLARNATLELGGPQAITPKEAVKTFEDVLEQSLEVTLVPEESLADQQDATADPMEQSFAGLMRAYARGDAIDMTETLAAIPVRMTSVSDYARTVLSSAEY
jgi:NADH dehydrogenase